MALAGVALVFAAPASAYYKYCRTGDRACQRAALLAYCVPVYDNSLNYWACPDAR